MTVNSCATMLTCQKRLTNNCREAVVPSQRQRDPTHRLSIVVGVSILFATLAAGGEALGEERRSNASLRQTVPPTQTYRSVPPVQTPASTALPGSWQYNSSAPNGGMRIEQYNPLGLNASGVSTASGTHPIQTNPPGLNTQHPEMAMPGGLGATGGAAASQSAPGSGGPPPGAAGSESYGSAYPVGYPGPSATQPYPYQRSSAAGRQFTCRTAHYYCVVPYSGACQCENGRREREPGATVD